MTLRLLLADDHRMMREGLRALLEAQTDMQVVGEVSNGRDAVERARVLAPDVVVMDIGMKELNGVEATRQVVKQCPEVRVVVLSTHSQEDYVHSALEAGASAYVLKIGAHEELVSAIRAAARGQRFLSPEVTGPLVDAGLQGVRRAGRSSPLSDREREVLQLVAEGRTSGEIAAHLDLATRTVEHHRQRLMQKLGLHSIAELTLHAVKTGLISVEDD